MHHRSPLAFGLTIDSSIAVTGQIDQIKGIINQKEVEQARMSRLAAGASQRAAP